MGPAGPGSANAPSSTERTTENSDGIPSPTRRDVTSGSSALRIAQSVSVWRANSRCFSAAYAASVPWRSMWSGVRFSQVAIEGRSRSTVSSWKLETSTTSSPVGLTWSATSHTARPMLPHTSTSRPAARSSAPTRSVVVLFPFVPVTHTNGACDAR